MVCTAAHKLEWCWRAGAVSKLSTVISSAGAASLLPGDPNMEGNQQQGAQGNKWWKDVHRSAQPTLSAFISIACKMAVFHEDQHVQWTARMTWEWGVTQPPHYLQKPHQEEASALQGESGCCAHSAGRSVAA